MEDPTSSTNGQDARCPSAAAACPSADSTSRQNCRECHHFKARSRGLSPHSCSPLVRPTFCRTHSPTSHPHFTYSAHTTHPPRRHSATVLQPPNNQFPIIFQSPLNHPSLAPRPRLVPSAATRTDIPIPPPTRQHNLQPCPNTEKAGGPKPARHTAHPPSPSTYAKATADKLTTTH